MNLDRMMGIELQQLEQWLGVCIRNHFTPFVGLLKEVFTSETRERINANLKDCYDPFDTYLTCLSRWPAVFLTYLTLYVAEGFGEHGTFEVYPFIEKALQIDELTNKQKDRLWKAYRKSCISLGFSVTSRFSGAHFMVEEYLRQAGVPLNYVKELTDKMMRYANIVGLPDDDDPSAIRLWQLGLCERLLPPFPKTARKAVEADDTGYYVRTFLKLLEQPTSLANAEDFESLMAAAIHMEESRAKNISSKKGLGVGIPQVVWRDQQLGIELPPGSSNWRITVNGVTADFSGMLESRFVPFDHDLPREVLIEHDQGLAARKITLWENEKNNRLLIFSSEGILIQGSQLGSNAIVSLEPGNYQLVMRFIPDGIDCSIEDIRCEPALYGLSIFIEPGQSLILSRGPAAITFKADSKPLLVWDGDSTKGVRGHDLFISSGTRLRVIIPSELLLEGQVQYFIRLNPGGLGQNIEIPVEDTSGGHLDIDISSLCYQWRPGVTRLLAEIQRTDMQRPAARSAIYFWNGLQRLQNRTTFICNQLPINLNHDESDNLLIDPENHILTYRNHDNRFFRMVFNLGEGKRYVFTSFVPGIFMQLKDYTDSHLTERSLRKGSTLSVAWNSRSVLEIFSTSNGTLSLGEFSKKVEFSTCGCKRLPLSGLVEYLGPLADTLRFVDEETGNTEDLLHLVSPHEVLNFSVRRKSDRYLILFSLAQEALAINLTANDILSGRTESVLLACNRAFERTESGINGWLTCDRDDVKGLYNHELRINIDNWPDGAWVLDLDANINGRWGGFSNSRGDAFCTGLIIIDGTLCMSTSCVEEDLKTMGLDYQFEVLQRIHEKLLYCYAIESWGELNWLEVLWHYLLARFDKQRAYAPQLISLAEMIAPDGSSSSWVPMLSISSHAPWIYALPAGIYKNISLKANSSLLKVLGTMSAFDLGLLAQIKESVLHQIFAFGFANVHGMMQGDEPKHFSLKTYGDAIRSLDLTERLRQLNEDDWQPGDGDYLGGLHYLYAVERLQHSYLDTLPGNDYRRGKALYLCRTLHHYQPNGIPAHLANGPGCLHFLNNATEDELTVDQDNVLLISQFLSQFAKVCRWEARKQGTLQQFMTKSRQLVADDDQFESILGYLLYIGREIFGFYLLLWEAILIADYTIEEG